MREIRLGTRQSRLALAQAKIVKNLIEDEYRDVSIRLIPMRTLGDNIQDSNMKFGKSVFTNDIETALLENKIDMAVHSMKDLPSNLHPSLVVAGTPERSDARDVLVTLNGVKLNELPPGAKIGTSSLRRKYQLIELRKDIQIVEIHGNVDTRIRKVEEKELDGIVVSASGLLRLGLEEKISQYFSVDDVIPAACQGILAIEVRNNDEYALNIAKGVNHTTTFDIANCERTFLQEVGGDCNEPVAAYSSMTDGRVSFLGLLGLPDGTCLLKERVESNGDCQALAKRVASILLSKIKSLDIRGQQ